MFERSPQTRNFPQTIYPRHALSYHRRPISIPATVVYDNFSCHHLSVNLQGLIAQKPRSVRICLFSTMCHAPFFRCEFCRDRWSQTVVCWQNTLEAPAHLGRFARLPLVFGIIDLPGYPQCSVPEALNRLLPRFTAWRYGRWSACILEISLLAIFHVAFTTTSPPMNKQCDPNVDGILGE